MQIFIKTLTGRKQQLNFELESTVLEVKQALQEKEGIQVDQIRYLYVFTIFIIQPKYYWNPRCFYYESRTSYHFEIAAIRSEKCNLFIDFFNIRLHSIDFSFFQYERLIYSGKQLADDKTLQEYNVAAGGTIHMVLQLRGG
jgi:hypothetical protein